MLVCGKRSTNFGILFLLPHFELLPLFSRRVRGLTKRTHLSPRLTRLAFGCRGLGQHSGIIPYLVKNDFGSSSFVSRQNKFSQARLFTPVLTLATINLHNSTGNTNASGIEPLIFSLGRGSRAVTPPERGTSFIRVICVLFVPLVAGASRVPCRLAVCMHKLVGGHKYTKRTYLLDDDYSPTDPRSPNVGKNNSFPVVRPRWRNFIFSCAGQAP